MSIELAVAWASRTLRLPRAADDAARMFEQAARDGRPATLLVSDHLSNDGKGWLARWTGSEVVVVELSARDQVGLGLAPGTLCRHLEDVADCSLQTPTASWSLSDVVLEGSQLLRADQPLIGSCQVACEAHFQGSCEACAVRAEYFQPTLVRQVTGYSHFNGPLASNRHDYRFSFPPLVSQRNPLEINGTVVLFLQLVTARNWSRLEGLQAISNTTAVVVEMRS